LKKTKFLAHVLFWIGLYLFWILAFRGYSLSLAKTMTVEFCYLLFITIDYYLISAVLIPRYLKRQKLFFFFCASALLIVSSAWLRALVSAQMNFYVFHSVAKTEFSDLFLNSILNISIWVLIITMARMFVERKKMQQRLELLEKERMKTELDFLKAQINPHTLFNSLNTIYGHIDRNNQVARNILLQFSGLLRYQLYDCSAEKISLEKEIEYIKNYVLFRQLRKEDDLIVNLEVSCIEGNLKIAPLLLVVLIENAFKFLSTTDQGINKICIKLFTSGTVLHSTFFNTTASLKLTPKPLMEPGGIGLTNLKRRLDLLYPDKYELNMEAESQHYQANLIIDLA
jgi:two-component system LytT family sensor kinase